MAGEAVDLPLRTTSEIEGDILDRASVQSSIRRQLGLSADPRRVKPAEQGMAEMTVDQYRHFDEHLTHKMLLSWHRMLMPEGPSGYRMGKGPMQVISGPMHAPQVHFEAPPARKVRKEMNRFLEWFARSAPGGSQPLSALTRAGTAHLYFVSIHPFEDGNGRIGRAIAEKALSQGMGQPVLTALAGTIVGRRRAYYDALEAANKRLEKALLRMLREGPAGFRGGLSAGNYVRITGASPATATRDLAGLVAMGALTRTGAVRHARYWTTVAAIQPEPYRG